MAAALMTDEPVVIRDVPDLSDIRNMRHLLESLGCRIGYEPARRTVVRKTKQRSMVPAGAADTTGYNDNDTDDSANAFDQGMVKPLMPHFEAS